MTDRPAHERGRMVVRSVLALLLFGLTALSSSPDYDVLHGHGDAVAWVGAALTTLGSGITLVVLAACVAGRLRPSAVGAVLALFVGPFAMASLPLVRVVAVALLALLAWATPGDRDTTPPPSGHLSMALLALVGGLLAWVVGAGPLLALLLGGAAMAIAVAAARVFGARLAGWSIAVFGMVCLRAGRQLTVDPTLGRALIAVVVAAGVTGVLADGWFGRHHRERQRGVRDARDRSVPAGQPGG